MADTKITALAPIGAIDPANDVLPIVDVSNNSMAASGTTCRVTTNQLLQANAIASLASATITGDLTVRTTGLTTTASAVGINTASPTANTLTIGANRFIICSDSQSKFGDNGLINGAAADGNTQIQFFGSKSLFFNEGVSTRMTLNSTGLGVGASPLGKFDVYNTGADTTTFIRSDTTRLGQIVFRDNADSANQGRVKYDHSTDTLSLFSGGNENVFLSSSGNVGIGVTPSASAGTSTLTARSGAFNNVSTAQTVSIADVYGGVIVITGVQGGLGSSTWTIPFVKRSGTLSIGTASKAVLTSDPISSVTVVSNNISITPVAANTFITFFIQYTPLGT